jgi:hypothetical protein
LTLRLGATPLSLARSCGVARPRWMRLSCNFLVRDVLIAYFVWWMAPTRPPPRRCCTYVALVVELDVILNVVALRPCVMCCTGSMTRLTQHERGIAVAAGGVGPSSRTTLITSNTVHAMADATPPLIFSAASGSSACSGPALRMMHMVMAGICDSWTSTIALSRAVWRRGPQCRSICTPPASGLESCEHWQ